MGGLAITPAEILRFALGARSDAADTILVTLVGIAGSSPRAIGAQMAVRADGDYIGTFSGGCIEAAIVAEALLTLGAGKSRLVRFGAGSPYIDVRLPCGGGIDLLFTPRPDPDTLRAVLQSLESREPAAMAISSDGVLTMRAAQAAADGGDEDFTVHYLPALRIVAMGHGDALIATARLARFFGAEVQAYSPARDDIRALADDAIDATWLESRSTPPCLATDAWTAFAFLFHEPDWEEALLPVALNLPHFYIGAVGGRSSQKARRDMLRGAGFDAAALDRFQAPPGLIPATRDPATLALSILSEIVARYQAGALAPSPSNGEIGFETRVTAFD